MGGEGIWKGGGWWLTQGMEIPWVNQRSTFCGAPRSAHAATRAVTCACSGVGAPSALGGSGGGAAEAAAAAASTARVASSSAACACGLCGGSSGRSCGWGARPLSSAAPGAAGSSARARATAASAIAAAAVGVTPNGLVEVAAQLLGLVLFEGGPAFWVIEHVGEGVNGGGGNVGAGVDPLCCHDFECIEALLCEHKDAMCIVAQMGEERLVTAGLSAFVQYLNMVLQIRRQGVGDLVLVTLSSGQIRRRFVPNWKKLRRILRDGRAGARIVPYGIIW